MRRTYKNAGIYKASNQSPAGLGCLLTSSSFSCV